MINDANVVWGTMKGPMVTKPPIVIFRGHPGEVLPTEQLMNAEPGHVEQPPRVEIADIIMESGSVSRSLDDLNPSNVREGHAIDLKGEGPICTKGYWLSKRDNNLVRKEMDKILRGSIAPPSSSPWSFRC